MDDSIQNRVFAFVAEKTSVRREKLRSNTTLSGDIGLNGDDAVEFFEAFRKEFAVDIEDLQLFWDHYFAPEGVTLSTGLLFAIPGLILAVLFTHLLPHMPDWSCFVLAYALWLASLGYLGRWRYKKRFPQVSIQDLIDTAKSGKWTKGPTTKVASSAATSGRDAGIFQR